MFHMLLYSVSRQMILGLAIGTVHVSDQCVQLALRARGISSFNTNYLDSLLEELYCSSLQQCHVLLGMQAV